MTCCWHVGVDTWREGKHYALVLNSCNSNLRQPQRRNILEALKLVTREHVLDAINRLTKGEEHQFGEARDYALLYDGGTYAPKAVLGIAAQIASGIPVGPRDFSGGEGSNQANQILRKLGFKVEPNLMTGSEDLRVTGDAFRTAVLDILANYINAKATEQVNDSRVRGYFQAAASALTKSPVLKQWLADSHVGWGIGQFMNWASVPWIGVMDRNHTRTALEGVYVVFLFREDMSGVYLSLNQGTTKLFESLEGSHEQRRAVLRDRAADFRRGLEWLLPLGFSLKNDIDLHTKAGRAINYEHSSIAHRFYKNTEIPSGEIIFKDLTSILDAYSQVLRSAPLADPNLPQQVAIHAADNSYGLDNALEDLFLEKSQLIQILSSAEHKKNLLLAGPPGVGKNFIADRIALLLVGDRDESRIARTQFHQTVSYENFVQGFRPKRGGGFEITDGLFLRFARRAQEDIKPHVLIIDEINRGNLSKIFGELLSLLEADKRNQQHAVVLTYAESDSEPFYIPPNLYIIGMMNTADRSLAFVDHALRRRFRTVKISPAFDRPQFRRFLEDRCGISLTNHIVNRFGELNKSIVEDKDLGPGFEIGHSYFCAAPPAAEDVEKWYNFILDFEIEPLLAEYWADSGRKAAMIVAGLRV